MASRQEKHPHREMLQIRVTELEAQQKLGITIAENVSDELGQTGQLDINTLLVASRRLERAQTDSAWLEVLLRRNIRPKEILEIWAEKDEYSRRMDGNND